MAHLHRFYVAPNTADEGAVTLDRDETHHALHVVRVTSGQKVLLFDGQGREFGAEVCEISRSGVSMEIVHVNETARPAVRVSVAQAWLNREKSIEDLIRRGTEIGIARFHFFQAEHSERPPRRQAKWERIAIEACKQCGRLWLPEFEVGESLATVLDSPEGLRLIATRGGQATPLRELVAGANKVTLVVGPEGDFSEKELHLAAKKGALPLSLGPATFRSEVAATLAGSLVLYELGELSM